MKISIAVKNDWSRVAGHAGQSPVWLIYDFRLPLQ